MNSNPTNPNAKIGDEENGMTFSDACVRANDKPPSHWTEKDGWVRHPQAAEEWNWKADAYPNAHKRSELRLNFAGDRADPHAPDQMALVLRMDLLRVMGRMQHAEAYKAMKLRQQAEASIVASPSQQGILEGLRKAEAFIEQELTVRKISFLPEGSPYIDEAQTVLDLVGAAISELEQSPSTPVSAPQDGPERSLWWIHKEYIASEVRKHSDESPDEIASFICFMEPPPPVGQEETKK